MIPFLKKNKDGKKPPKSTVPRTAQESIPFQRMFEDGTCRVRPGYYTRTIQYQDINYQLAQQEDKTAIFEEWCSFLNFFDSSIHFELSFVNTATDSADFEKSIRIPYQQDGFDDVRAEYSQMLRQQLSKGNNGLTKTKFLTYGIEGDSMAQVKPRLEHIQNDLMNNFHRLGVLAKPLDGTERLRLMHGMLNMDGANKFHFNWKDLVPSGLSVKDAIAPTALAFKNSRTFQMGGIFGAVSFLNITASDLSDQLLKDFLDMDSSQIVTMHIQSVDQNKAIKTIKHTITELDRSKIEEQKKAVRAGYDMDVLPSDLATYGRDAKALLKELQSQNERMFLVTFLVLNTGKTEQELETNVFQAVSIAQKHNCELCRLDFQQEQGLMSSLPLADCQIEIQRGLTTSSTAIFVPFTTQELFDNGKESLYYGLNALSNNLIMVDRKKLKNPKGLYHKGTGTPRKTQATAPFAAQMDRQPQERSGNKSDPRMPYWIVEKNKQKDFENSSVLPPVFLLLVRGSNPILTISDYPPKNQERSFTVFYINHSHNSIWKGANPMKSDNKNKANNNEGGRFSKRIGSTTYLVSVHFSKTSKETFEDKMMRFVESEVRKTA